MADDHGVWILSIGVLLGLGAKAPGFHFVNVGQGAALVVVGSQAVVVVDSGPASGAEAIMKALGWHGLQHVDLWIHTHFDADHLGGFSRVVAGADAEEGSEDDVTFDLAWDRGTEVEPATDAMAEYSRLVGDRRFTPRLGERFESDELVVEVVGIGAPTTAAELGENERGLALCIQLAGHRLFVPGDRSAASLWGPAQRCAVTEVLWVPHHGSASGLTPELLATLRPSIAIISAGRDNPHCHPHPRTLAHLAATPTWILDAAGIRPFGSCAPLRDHLGPMQRITSADLWLGAESLERE